jgi:hypothetical protein
MAWRVKKTPIDRHCGIAAHEEMKLSRARIEAETTFVGWQRDAGRYLIELRNCKRCDQTLALESGFLSKRPR